MKWSACAATAACVHLLVRGPVPPVGDVVPDGAVEQPRVLQHHAERAAQCSPRITSRMSTPSTVILPAWIS